MAARLWGSVTTLHLPDGCVPLQYAELWQEFVVLHQEFLFPLEWLFLFGLCPTLQCHVLKLVVFLV